MQFERKGNAVSIAQKTKITKEALGLWKSEGYSH